MEDEIPGEGQIDAVKTDNFDFSKFESMETLTQSLIDSHDKLVNGSFIAFSNFDLWNAWYRIWALGGTFNSLRFRSAHVKYKMTKDIKYLNDLENHQIEGALCANLEELNDIFITAYDVMLNVESGNLSIDEAVKKLYSLYDADWIPPIYNLNNPEKRYVSKGDVDSFIESSMWGYNEAPQKIKDLYFDFPSEQLEKAVIKSFSDESEWLKNIDSAFHYPGSVSNANSHVNSPLLDDETKYKLAIFKEMLA